MVERMYSDLADWWHLLSAPEDYAEEAAVWRWLIVKSAKVPVRRALELGSGGGNNASHLKPHFQMTLVDRSENMLAMSRRLNPECEHLQGDMRDVRLGREFDAVFVHDAVVYMTTREELRRAIETAYVHCAKGGVALFCPDYVRETFEPATRHGGHDGDEGRAMRYLEWVTDPDPDDETYTVDYAFLLRDAGGAVRVEHDRHVEGLFATDVWLQLLRGAGFEARAERVDLEEEGMLGSVAFVGVKT